MNNKGKMLNRKDTPRVAEALAEARRREEKKWQWQWQWQVQLVGV